MADKAAETWSSHQIRILSTSVATLKFLVVPWQLMYAAAVVTGPSRMSSIAGTTKLLKALEC